MNFQAASLRSWGMPLPMNSCAALPLRRRIPCRQEADAEIKLGRVHDEGEHARGMVEHGGASRHDRGVEAQVL